MRILNFGSLNIDYVYEMDHFVEAGETAHSHSLELFCGGKGLNQSIALARAGATVCHAGHIGRDGLMLAEALVSAGVDTSYLKTSDGQSGHAIIQVSREGDNCIILHGGTNQQIDEAFIEETFNGFSEGDLLLIQNEVNNLEKIIRAGASKGMVIAFNPAPMDASIQVLPLDLIDILIVNEVEGAMMTGHEASVEILSELADRYPDMEIVLTLGADGVMYRCGGEMYSVKANTGINVIDTTAAGDTFIGYFLTSRAEGLSAKNSLIRARNASEICITRRGASDSIPTREEVSDE